MQQAYNILLKMRTTEVEVLDEVSIRHGLRICLFSLYPEVVSACGDVSSFRPSGVLQGSDAALWAVGSSCHGCASQS